MNLMRRRTARFCQILLLLLIATTLAMPLSTMAATEESDVSGLFDEAGKFDQQERDSIENAIGEVEAAGAPTVVYLQLIATDDDRAVGYAQDLMEEWEVESSLEARDGVVIFFNLDPEDTDRGEFGIVAGESHFDDGALPQSRLNRIRDDMIDLLADDRMAEAIVLGLEMTADYLESGPPEPTQFELFMERIAGGPLSLLNGLMVGITAVVAFLGARTWRDRPQATNVIEPVQTTPPSDLHPSIAGALVRGNVDYLQVEALLLDLAQNGAIALEPDPDDPKKTQIRILSQRRTFSEAELALLTILVEESDEDQLLDQESVVRTQQRWPEVQKIIQDDLEERGWFDPEVGRKRRPLWVIGTPALFIGGLAAIIPAATLEDLWAGLGGGLLALIGFVLVLMAMSYPRTTIEGQRLAAAWRGYNTGLKRASKDQYGSIDLDDSFPYIVSMGLLSDFENHFKEANTAGYVPRWVRSNDYQNQQLAPYWHIHLFSMHHAMHTASSGGAGGAGGAATGSGGAGGRF